VQPRIIRPIGCDISENIENKVNGGRQGDASDLRGSDGIVRNNCRNSRGIRENDNENPVGIIGNDSCKNFVGIVANDSEEIIPDDLFCHYEVYIVSRELKVDLGVALLDSGSQVSLVRESSLVKFSEEKNGNFQIYGITGKEIKIKGKLN
jgi:hypothetical protein